jgi:hypothetical protein
MTCRWLINPLPIRTPSSVTDTRDNIIEHCLEFNGKAVHMNLCTILPACSLSHITYNPIHQSARCQLPTTAVRSIHIKFVVNKVTLGQVLWFPLQLSFHELLYTHLPSGADIIDPVVAGVPSGLRLTSKYK